MAILVFLIIYLVSRIYLTYAFAEKSTQLFFALFRKVKKGWPRTCLVILFNFLLLSAILVLVVISWKTLSSSEETKEIIEIMQPLLPVYTQGAKFTASLAYAFGVMTPMLKRRSLGRSIVSVPAKGSEVMRDNLERSIVSASLKGSDEKKMLKICKVDAHNNFTPFVGAVFDLFQEQADGSWRLTDLLVTDADGKAESDTLSNGHWRLIEDIDTNSTIRPTELIFTVNPDDRILTFTTGFNVVGDFKMSG